MLQTLTAAVLASVLTALIIYGAKVPGTIRRNDRLARQLNDDLRRWVRDRNRDLEAEMSGIRNSVGKGHYSAAFPNQLAAMKARALHQYRDEASRSVRANAALGDDEGPLHSRWRSAGSELQRPGLPADCLETLTEWRADVDLSSVTAGAPVPVEDVSAGESEIAALEANVLD